MNRNLRRTGLFVLVFFLFWFGAPQADAAAPTITTLSPATGAIGASVTITGTNFGSTGTVTFNGTATTTSSWTATSIVATVPTGATTGNVIVTVSGVASNTKTFTVVPGPVISSLSITTGAVGAVVTVTGTSFGSTQGSGTVKFNGVLATITTWTATSIAVKVPTGATTGNVVVFASGVNSGGEIFTVVAAPSITSISISTGAVGASVTVTGTGFGSPQGTSTIKFNGTTATASNWTATNIVTTVPSGASTGNIVVHASGVDSGGKSFTVVSAPSITSLSPVTGAVGASVSVHGANFGSTQGLGTVKFNGTAATVSSWGASTIAVTVPAGATTGNVVVFASGVNSGGSAFTVVPAPSITSLSGSSGATGSTVTITGTNFGSTQGSGTVKFNGTTATITTWGATSIVVKVPSGATTGNIVVFASGVNSNGAAFTVTPTISSVSPSSGAVGASVTISGTGFAGAQGGSNVTFNGTVATGITSWTNTSIAATVPASATTGNVVVSVGGFASNGKSFTLKPTPSVSTTAPTFGAIGVPVTINGANLGTSGTITFNGTAATATAWTASQITVPVPTGATTGQLVVTASGVNLNCGNFIVETITSLSVTPSTVSLPINSLQQFITTANYSDGKSQSLGGSATWTSSSPTTGAISSTGLLIAGGQGQTTVQATFNTFNASANVTVNGSSPFIRVGNLITPRFSHTATLLQNGKVLIAGGIDANFKDLASAELYDPITQTFSPTGSMLSPLVGHTATLLPSGKVLIAGGGSVDSNGNGIIVASGELYDPVAGTFSYTTGFMTEGHSEHTATLLSTGQVLIAGGSYYGSGGYERADSELYNPATDTFSVTGNMVTPRELHSATLLNDGTVLIAGGDTLNAQFQTYYVGSAEIYNPSTGSFAAVGILNFPSEYHTASLQSTGKVVIVDGEYYCSTCNAPLLSRTETYDPTAQTFSMTATMALARFDHTASTLTDGTILIVGGDGATVTNGISGYAPTGTAELLNPASQTVTGAGSMQDARVTHTATLLNDGTVLIAGGTGVDGILGSAELYSSTPPTPYSLQVTPASASLTVGDTRQFTAVDNNGYPRSGVVWSVSNSSLAIISSASAPATLTGLGAGQVTLTASDGGVSAQALVTIAPVGSTPTPGTANWSAPLVPGFSPLQLAQAMPSYVGPDLYSIQLSASGIQSVVQAFTSDGQQMWQTPLPAVNAMSIPDALGGLLITENNTCNQGQTVPMTIVDLNPTNGEPLWQIAAQGIPGLGVGGGTLYCYPDAPQFAIRGADGAVVISAPGNTSGLPELSVVNGTNGQAIYTPTIPASMYQNSDGSYTNGYSPIGAPIVNSDGSIYVEYEVRTIAYPVKIASAELYLFVIAADGAQSSVQLSSTTTNENLFPGRIIPDGQGGVLATWTIVPSNGTIPPNPYQAAHVVSGAVATTYALPFTPNNFVLGPDGLPVNISLILGEGGTAFGTDGVSTGDRTNPGFGPKIAAFSIASGAVAWSYQNTIQSTFAILAAVSGGGLIVQDSQLGILQLDSGGGSSQFPGNLGANPQFSWIGTWEVQNSQGISDIQQSVVLADSFWGMPGGNESGNGLAIEQIQANQPQGSSPITPPMGSTLNISYNSIELLTTVSPAQIFSTYILTFLGLQPPPSGNNDVATVPAQTNITGSGQTLTFTLEGIFGSTPLVWVGLGQGPFAVLTRRFDTMADTLSIVTLQGHPLEGWRYWSVYSIGTNDVVIETGGADLPAPGPINALGTWLLHYKQLKLWKEELQFISSSLRTLDPNATQGSNPAYNHVNGEWKPSSPTQAEVLFNVCQSSWCN